MSSLSPAAKGQRRGVLEILKEPPAPFADMSSGEDALNPTIFTYSVLGLVGSFSLIAAPFEVPFFLGIIFFFLIPLFFVGIGVPLYNQVSDSSVKFRSEIVYGIQRTAKLSVHGREASLSDNIARSVGSWKFDGHEYVDNLTPRQKRWIAKRWEKELSIAMDIRKNGKVSGIEDVNNIVDPQRIKEIATKLDELETLRKNTAPVSSFDDFDRQLKEAEKI